MQLIDDNVDLREFLEQPQEAHKIRRAGDWAEDVVNDFWRPRAAPRRGLGFNKTRHDFEIRPAEVSLWAGINGHGKSQFLGQVKLQQLMADQRICEASLEMPPMRTMSRLTRQAYGEAQPPADYIRAFSRWTDGRLWLYDHVGPCRPDVMIAIIRYAVHTFGVDQFIVDNLTKVVDGEDNYNAQKDFVNRLCEVAHDTGVHIHLVAHVRKGRSENDQPGKFDVKGAGSITDLVDNVFMVWRNKAKEDAIRSNNLNYDRSEPDTILQLEKQRNGEAEGDYRFWFHPGALQFLETTGEGSRRMVEV